MPKEDLVIKILPDGRVILPRNKIGKEIALALGDKKAAKYCEQNDFNEVIIGKKMCG